MSKNPTKIFSSFNLIILIVLLLALGGFILVSSGMFDEATVNTTQHTHTGNDQNINNTAQSTNLDAVNKINELEDVVKKNPNNFEALLSLGHLLNDNGFYDKAIVKYEKYLVAHPKNIDVIVDMGVCYFELKNYEKSINVIKSALALNPKHQIANFNLGIVNLANSNHAEAKTWWAKARDIDPTTNIGKKAEELLKSNN